MPAGTIALTNKSTTVSGTGTSFTTELKAGDFVYVNVGGAPYTLVAANITSDTQLTLSVAFDGPTTSGLAWNAVPASLQVAITQKILNDFASVARGRILDFQNWQAIFSDSPSVTVTRPDRTQFTGPSWGYIAEQYSGKANSADVLTKEDNLGSVANKETSRKNLGLKGASLLEVGTTANTVAAGNDSRFNTIDGNSGGTLGSSVVFNGATGYKISSQAGSTEVVNGESRNYLYYSNNSAGGTVLHYQFSLPGQYTSAVFSIDSSIFQLRSSGVGYSPSGWQTYSDGRTKDKKAVIDKPIARLFKLRGYTFEKFGIPGTGVIAQEALEAIPEAVSNSGDLIRPDNGELVKDALAINPGDLVGLLIEVCRDQEERIEQRDTAIAELEKRMKSIDGLDS